MPAHLPFQCHRVLVARGGCLCLRCARFFSILIQKLRLGLLPSLTFSTTVALPIAARFIAESEVVYARLLNDHVRQAAYAAGVEWPADADRRARASKGLAAPQSPPGSPAATECDELAQPAMPIVPIVPAVACAPVAPTAALISTECVPTGLLRDHAILSALARCLHGRAKTSFQGLQSLQVAPDEICTMARAIAPVLSRTSDASLKQAVAWVCREVTRRAVEQDARFVYSIEYSERRDRKIDSKIAGVCCQGDGVEFFTTYVTSVVTRMSCDGAAFEKDWKPTRSAKAMGKQVNLK